MASISGQSTSNIDNVDGFFTTQGGSGTASPSPTFTVENSVTYFNNSITITNHGSYTDPTFQVIVERNGVEIVNTVTPDTSIAWADTADVSLTRTIKVRAQEFGDFIQSAEVTSTYTKSALGFRYFRIYGSSNGTTPSTGWFGIMNFRIYSGAGQTGTQYPANLTSDSSGESSGYFVDSDYVYSSSYAAYKAFDSNLNSWSWTLSVPTAARNYNGFYFDPTIFPTVPTMSSMTFRSYSTPSAAYALFMASNTGAFSGEETLIASARINTSSNATYNFG